MKFHRTIETILIYLKPHYACDNLCCLPPATGQETNYNVAGKADTWSGSFRFFAGHELHVVYACWFALKVGTKEFGLYSVIE